MKARQTPAARINPAKASRRKLIAGFPVFFIEREMRDMAPESSYRAVIQQYRKSKRAIWRIVPGAGAVPIPTASRKARTAAACIPGVETPVPTAATSMHRRLKKTSSLELPMSLSCACAKVCAHGDKTSVRFRTTARSPTNRACRKINAGHVMSIPHATDAQRNTKHAAIPSAVRAV